MIATLSAREAFCAVLSNGPLLPASAVVVFSGDGFERCQVALWLLRQRACHWALVSGGLDNPPHSLTAETMGEYLIEKGLAPDRIIHDSESLHTHAQAEWLATMLLEPPDPWEFPRVFLALSPYHQYRAFLTVLASLQRHGLDEKVHVIPVAGGHSGWWAKPAGSELTRLDWLADEFRKIDEYAERGHVASYHAGLEYLRFWEGHTDDAR